MRWTISLLVLLPAIGSFADPQDNPAYRAWARFQPGAMAVMSTVTMQGDAKQADVETTSRLIEVHPDKVIVEHTGSMEAGDSRVKLPTERQEIAAKAPAAKPPPGKPVEKVEETIEVGGRKLRAYRTHHVDRRGAVLCETTLWNSDEVPGGIVREMAVIRGAQVITTRTELLRWEGTTK